MVFIIDVLDKGEIMRLCLRYSEGDVAVICIGLGIRGGCMVEDTSRASQFDRLV